MKSPLGRAERWRFINACNARYVRLSIGGRPFRIIGGDGGLRDQAVTVTEMLLTPGERVELAVGPFEDEGVELAIESLPYRRTAMKRPRRELWGTLRCGCGDQCNCRSTCRCGDACGCPADK